MTDRGAVDAEMLLKVVLILVVIWIAFEIITEFLNLTFGLFGPILGLVILALIILWLLGRL